ncbi:Pogo transposable element-like 79, partial [Homarus americanus]
VSRRHKYNIAFKLEVVRYAKEHGNRATERNFGPPPTEMMISHTSKMARLRRKLENMDIRPKKLGFGSDDKDDHFGSKKVCSTHRDGTKLPPLLIFKRKTLPKERQPNGIHVIVQPKGWMDGEGVKVWLDKVWSKRPGGLLRKNSLLVWDQFSAHRTENTKRLAKGLNTQLAVIPGGPTSQLQPLDVGINKPFKNNMREQRNKWMTEGNMTPTARMKRPSIPE